MSWSLNLQLNPGFVAPFICDHLGMLQEFKTFQDHPTIPSCGYTCSVQLAPFYTLHNLASLWTSTLAAADEPLRSHSSR